MPGSTTSNRLWYIYVLESFRGGKKYVGYSRDLRERYLKTTAGRRFLAKRL